VPALRRLVRVVEEATPNVVALVMVFLPIGMLTAAMYAQLFGLFDEVMVEGSGNMGRP
jgi:hypothetical protein